jgi:ABC-type anion transport system duplicated permease subunit
MMADATSVKDPWWWYWVVTFVFIVAALAGWSSGYGVVILISAAQACHSILRNRSIASFPAQIRLVYFAVTLFGLWEGPRFYVFALLLVGTFMVAAFGRCAIALALKPMPWNRGREFRLN